jgi:uncharacterized protein (TIGR03000 family)
MFRSTILVLAVTAMMAVWPDQAQAQRYRGGNWGRQDNVGNAVGNYLGYGYNQPYWSNYGYSGYGYYPNYYGSNYGYNYPRYNNWSGYQNYSYSYPNYSYSNPNYYSYNTTPNISSYTYPNSSNSIPYTGSYAANPGQTSTSYYGENQQLQPNQIRVKVTLPDPNARLIVENQPNQFQGNDRIIMSPPMDPNANMNYSYTMKATWMENGQEVTREKKIDVKLGQEYTVNFNEAS